MDFNNYEELHKLIAEVVDEKYKIAIANITYLEEIDNKCYVIYMTQFRDVLNHLSRIYSCEDIVSSKAEITEQLERISGHLERVVIDSFRKITDSLLRNVLATCKPRDKNAFRIQIAQEVRDLRLSNQEVSFEDKLEGFQKMVEYLEELLKKD